VGNKVGDRARSGVGCGVGVLQRLLEPGLQGVLLRPSPLEHTRIFVAGQVTVSVGRIGVVQKTTRVLLFLPARGRDVIRQHERE
jgi:hypothetical protein